jgi:hypothetical protein
MAERRDRSLQQVKARELPEGEVDNGLGLRNPQLLV